MLSEDGYVIDDGVVMRLAEDRFHVTTTTGGAARVFAVMEDYRQTEWPDLRVWATSITEQYATIAINGPKARDILAPLVDGIDLSAAAFPHMSVREGKVAGVAARLARVSYTGEVGFEVNVPADFGESVLEAIWAEGEKVGAVAYGLDALYLLRAEKGYMMVGQDTDGSVTPDDLGLSRMVAAAKPDFIGKRSLSLADLARAGRRQLVGLLPEDPTFVPDEGAQIVAEAAPPKGAAALGWVTSAYLSPTLQRSFALALIADGRNRLGEVLFATTMEAAKPVKLVEPVFYDKEGRRLELCREAGRRTPLDPERARLARQRLRQGNRRAVRRALDPARRTGGQRASRRRLRRDAAARAVARGRRRPARRAVARTRRVAADRRG